MRVYLELLILYNEIDKNYEKKMTVEGFKQALVQLYCWGIEVEDPVKTFNEIGVNGDGEVLFLEFATWV